MYASLCGFMSVDSLFIAQKVTNSSSLAVRHQKSQRNDLSSNRGALWDLFHMIVVAALDWWTRVR